MDPVDTGLALPVAGMLTLTLVVWVYLFVQRIGYMTANQVDAEAMVTPADVQRLLPPEASSAAHNFRNLFEVPVVFSVVCLFLTLFGLVDSLHIYCAWAFLGLRSIHRRPPGCSRQSQRRLLPRHPYQRISRTSQSV